MIEQNILSIKERVKRAVNKSSDPADRKIDIVCVVKYAQLAQIKEVVEQGLCELGENRVQAAIENAQALKENSVHWHMVGHLQANKVKKAVGLFELIHSVDSLRLAYLIDKEARGINKIQRVLIQVNTRHKKDAYGIEGEKLGAFLREIKTLKNINVCGLMTIAPLCNDPQQTRPYFRVLRELKIKMEKKNRDVELPVLSMGMSLDFEIAVEEGANMLRIGRAIFETG